MSGLLVWVGRSCPTGSSSEFSTILPWTRPQKTESAAIGRAPWLTFSYVFRIADCLGQLCHVFELYFVNGVSGLEGIGAKRGLDKKNSFQPSALSRQDIPTPFDSAQAGSLRSLRPLLPLVALGIICTANRHGWKAVPSRSRSARILRQTPYDTMSAMR